LSSAQIQGITILPGQWLPAGRAGAVSAKVGQVAMPANTTQDDPERARRFREAALPHLDDVYTLARYLLRDASDAEDAVQECYLRALKHFDTYRGPAMKPWLFAILRNVCRAEYARRASAPATVIDDTPEAFEQTPLWHEEQQTPEAELLRERDASAIRRMVDALAEPFKETFVLREINNLSYREIADAVGAPVGTVMSRLARARAMLRSAWLKEQEPVR
jgi:RNA polymerase sigma-70 factor (ECF subfamily)